MSELLTLQMDVIAALRDAGADARAARWLAGDPAHLERRLAIYRANMLASAEKALSAAYPVSRQVVGDDFFRGLARAFQRETPSTSGDLGDYGIGFPDFLAAFAHTQSLPYLADLARLEWAAHRAYGAADAPDWVPSALAAVDPEDQAAIRFAWSAGTAVVDSPFPIVRLWTIHQPGYTGEFDVDWRAGECALVARDGFAVRVSALARGDAAFLRAALAGAALGDAASAALELAPDFDLGALLARAVATRLVCGFTVEPT